GNCFKLRDVMAKQWFRPWLQLLGYVLFLGIIWFSARNYSSTPVQKEVPYSEFVTQLRAGHFEQVRIDPTVLTGTLKQEAVKNNEPREITTQRLPGIDESSLLKDLEDQGVTFTGHTVQPTWWMGALTYLIPILFLVFVYGFGLRRMASGPG